MQFSLYYSLEIKVRESNCQRLIQRGYLMLCKESPNHVRHQVMSVIIEQTLIVNIAIFYSQINKDLVQSRVPTQYCSEV